MGTFEATYGDSCQYFIFGGGGTFQLTKGYNVKTNKLNEMRPSTSVKPSASVRPRHSEASFTMRSQILQICKPASALTICAQFSKPANEQTSNQQTECV
jgi:hypothetical protein